MAEFQTPRNNQCVFDPLLVFNEVQEANSVRRFNFITAGESRLHHIFREEGMKRKRFPGGRCITYFQMLWSLKLPLLFTQGKVFNLFHNRIHLKHLTLKVFCICHRLNSRRVGWVLIRQSGAVEEHRHPFYSYFCALNSVFNFSLSFFHPFTEPYILLV